jgi:hypothetical protein
MAATEITDVTPMTIPSTVSVDRPFRARSVSSATDIFSRMSRFSSKLLRPQRGHRIETRRSHRRIDPEEDADRRAKNDA